MESVEIGNDLEFCDPDSNCFRTIRPIISTQSSRLIQPHRSTATASFETLIYDVYYEFAWKSTSNSLIRRMGLGSEAVISCNIVIPQQAGKEGVATMRFSSWRGGDSALIDLRRLRIKTTRFLCVNLCNCVHPRVRVQYTRSVRLQPRAHRRALSVWRHRLRSVVLIN